MKEPANDTADVFYEDQIQAEDFTGTGKSKGKAKANSNISNGEPASQTHLQVNGTPLQADSNS